MIEAAQHSVHPIPDKERRGHGGGSLRVFRQFAWLEVGSVKMAFSRPAHPQVTRAVGRTDRKELRDPYKHHRLFLG